MISSLIISCRSHFSQSLSTSQHNCLNRHKEHHHDCSQTRTSQSHHSLPSSQFPHWIANRISIFSMLFFSSHKFTSALLISRELENHHCCSALQFCSRSKMPSLQLVHKSDFQKDSSSTYPRLYKAYC